MKRAVGLAKAHTEARREGEGVEVVRWWARGGVGPVRGAGKLGGRRSRRGLLRLLCLLLLLGLGLGGLVDQVDQAAEVDARVVAEAHLAGAAGGVAIGAAAHVEVLHKGGVGGGHKE